MTTIDLTHFDDEGFVLHFGGRTHEVNAVTFGNVLVSIAEAIRAINSEVNPGYNIEIAIEAVGPGSFRARLKTAKKSLRNLFSTTSTREVVVALFATFLWEKVLDPEKPPVIVVNDGSVILEYGGDRIIIPTEANEQRKRVENSSAVNRHVARAMEAMEQDPAIESFGIARKLADDEPVIDFPKEQFPLIRQNATPPAEGGRQTVDHDAVLSVHKAVFERSSRRWEFIWNGFKISAPITDQTFFDRLAAREFSIAQGDAFNAVLRVHQIRDPMSGTWVNERYEVVRVFDRRHQAMKQVDTGL